MNLPDINLSDFSPGAIAAALAAISAKVNEKLLLEIYGDVKKAGVSQVGKALANVIDIACSGIELKSQKRKLLRDYHLEQYRKKLESVPEDKIVEVAPELGVPIIEKLEKTTNEKLSEMYINLLTNASIEEYAGNVHPRFITVIENLTPDEVRMIDSLKSTADRVPYINILKVQEYHPKRIVRTVHAEKVTRFENSQHITMPEKSKFYLDNLEGQGILTSCLISESRQPFSDEYDDLLSYYPELSDFNFQLHNTVEIEKGFYNLTHFGFLFKQACSVA